jgi:hypothetical protein
MGAANLLVTIDHAPRGGCVMGRMLMRRNGLITILAVRFAGRQIDPVDMMHKLAG